MTAVHRNVQRVIDAGAERGVRVVPRQFPEGTKTAVDATGFPIGGVPPFGHVTSLQVFIDPDLLHHDEVWAAAGTWTDVFGLTPHQLVEASGGMVIDLKRG
ncbi:MAG TPA: YbaK/EbsC family protein [Ilumatobacter sp.]|nr:YbaK/EbsC family protein [Ilumatobacter sp.]